MVSVWNILGSFWAPMSKMVHITFKWKLIYQDKLLPKTNPIVQFKIKKILFWQNFSLSPSRWPWINSYLIFQPPIILLKLTKVQNQSYGLNVTQRLLFPLLPVRHISPVVHIFYRLFITRNIAKVSRALPATEQNTSWL